MASALTSLLALEERLAASNLFIYIHYTSIYTIHYTLCILHARMLGGWGFQALLWRLDTTLPCKAVACSLSGGLRSSPTPPPRSFTNVHENNLYPFNFHPSHQLNTIKVGCFANALHYNYAVLDFTSIHTRARTNTSNCDLVSLAHT